MKDAGDRVGTIKRRGLYSLWGKERHTVRREAGVVATAEFRLARFRERGHRAHNASCYDAASSKKAKQLTNNFYLIVCIKADCCIT